MIPEELNPIGLIIKDSIDSSYTTLIEVEVPIPIFLLDFTVSVISSPLVKLCSSVVSIVEILFSTLAVTGLNVVSSEYWKSLLSPFGVKLVKNKPSDVVVSPIWVTNPMKSLDLLMIYNFCSDPEDGILNGVDPEVVDTPIKLPDVGILNDTSWFVLNGWFGIKIDWFGTDIFFLLIPSEYSTLFPTPLVVPIPIDSFGLKYTVTFPVDSK